MSETKRPREIEEWAVLDFLPRVSVSNLGRVRTNRTTTFGSQLPSGYMRIYFRVNGRDTHFMVHRLVMHAFKGKIPEGQDVNHLNGVKHDNRLVNLEYCSRSENLKHAYKIGLKIAAKGSAKPRALFTEDQIKQIHKMSADGMSNKEISEVFNVQRQAVWRVVSGFHYAGPYEKKGRARGERSGLAKITLEIAREIRKRHQAGAKGAQIAKELNISQDVVSRVVTNKTYREL